LLPQWDDHGNDHSHHGDDDSDDDDSAAELLHKRVKEGQEPLDI